MEMCPKWIVNDGQVFCFQFWTTANTLIMYYYVVVVLLFLLSLSNEKASINKPVLYGCNWGECLQIHFGRLFNESEWTLFKATFRALCSKTSIEEKKTVSSIQCSIFSVALFFLMQIQAITFICWFIDEWHISENKNSFDQSIRRNYVIL